MELKEGRLSGKSKLIPGPSSWTRQAPAVPLPYDSRVEMRAGEWEWRTLFYRGRHPHVDRSEGATALFDVTAGMTLVGDLIYLYTPFRVVLMVILRFELQDEEFEELERWLSTQIDDAEREVAVEYFLGSYLKGWYSASEDPES